MAKNKLHRFSNSIILTFLCKTIQSFKSAFEIPIQLFVPNFRRIRNAHQSIIVKKSDMRPKTNTTEKLKG